MKPDETCKKLEPIIGGKANKLHKLYLLEDFKGRSGVEEAINLVRVQKLNEDEILLPPPENLTGEYPIGDIIYNGKACHTFYLKKKNLCRHVGIFGTTGSGKTNSCFYLIANLHYNNIPFLITDWKQNYRDLLKTQIGKNLKIYTVGKSVAPFHFNPLIPPKGVDPKTYINKLIDVINHSHFVSYGVDTLLQITIDSVYKECGIYSEMTKAPTFKDVQQHLDLLKVSGRESLWKASAMRTLQDLTFGPVGDVFNTEHSIDIQNLLSQKVVLELDTLPQTTKAFLVESLLLQTYLFRVNEDRERDEELRHLFIIEEAHHMLLKKKEQEETITDLCLRELRELGQGFCILDQSPSLISNTALANINTLVAMQLRHQDDIRQVSKALLLDLDEQKHFGKLKTGEAIVKTEHPNPFLLRFPHAAIKKGTVSNEDIRRHMQNDLLISSSTDSEKNSLPEAQIIQNNEIRITDILSKEETEFLKDITAHPLSGVSNRYKRLGLSVEKGNEIKNTLIEKEILNPVSLPTKNARVLLLEPTKTGKEMIKSLGLNYLKGFKGGVVHEYWRMKVSYHYKNMGYNVKHEVPIGQGKTIDMVVEKDGQETAVEIETGKSKPIENIKKCSDYQRIICVATNSAAEKQINEKLTKENMATNQVKIIGSNRYF